MVTTDIDWAQFCKLDSHRFAIGEPCVRDGNRYATDTRVLIAVPTDEPATDMTGRGRFPKTEFILDQMRYVETWQTWPGVFECSACGGHPNIQHAGGVCPKCNGKEAKKCLTCHGDGIVECNLGHEHDCDDCDGEGEKDWCEECDGEGVVEPYVTECQSCGVETMNIGGRKIALRYVAAIGHLPGPVVYGIVPRTTDDQTVFFKFSSGGRGAVIGKSVTE